MPILCDLAPLREIIIKEASNYLTDRAEEMILNSRSKDLNHGTHRKARKVNRCAQILNCEC